MKTYRLSAPIVIAELEEIAKTTGLSPDQIIEIALIRLFGDDGNFISCPECEDRLAIKGTQSGEQQVEVFRCGCCGTSVVYDVDKEVILQANNDRN
jgi:hypothetical protein